MKITVLGAGGWGLALALSAFYKGHEVAVWSPFQQEADALLQKRENPKLLSGIQIPQEIKITTDFSCTAGRDAVIIATPSFAVAETAGRLAQVKDLKLVINVAKGFDPATGNRLSTVIAAQVSAPVVVLSGPSHAEEVARRIPTSVVAASEHEKAARQVVTMLASEYLRIYTNDDVVGVELGGALKNIIAVAVGFCDGMRLGDNTKAALMTRGLTEFARLGVVMGAKERTFAGLTGLGDLIVTCTSVHSRNHRFGTLIGQGALVQDALKTVGTVEGYYACKIAYENAQKIGVELPILEQCYHILYENAEVTAAIRELMLRPSRDEHELMWVGE